MRALYLDTEGHVIEYQVAAWEEGIEEVSEGATRYRLRVLPLGERRARLTFYVAEPGEEFVEHVSGEVERSG